MELAGRWGQSLLWVIQFVMQIIIASWATVLYKHFFFLKRDEESLVNKQYFRFTCPKYTFFFYRYKIIKNWKCLGSTIKNKENIQNYYTLLLRKPKQKVQRCIVLCRFLVLSAKSILDRHMCIEIYGMHDQCANSNAPLKKPPFKRQVQMRSTNDHSLFFDQTGYLVNILQLQSLFTTIHLTVQHF